MSSLSTKQALLLVFGISLILFYPFLGMVHLFDWDEINFAEGAREMLVTGNYSTVQINYKPFWEKPPLFLWMQLISMKLFGVGEYAARFPNAVVGTLSLIAFTLLGKRIKDLKFGLIWAGLYAASLLPQLYFKSGIIDPWFNLFIFCGIWLAYEYLNSYLAKQEKLKYIALAGISIGLGVMTKGPVALLIFLMVAGLYWASQRFKIFFSWKAILIFLATLVLAGGFWFFMEIINGRFYIVQDFINYQIRLLQTQDAGHGGPFFYHWVVLLVGCFPLSIPAIWGMGGLKKLTGTKEKSLHIIMLILFWSVLILFSLVKTKIIHYSSMCYFPLSFFAAKYVYQHWEEKNSKFHNVLLATIGTILGLVLLLAPAVGANLDIILNSGLMNDPFAEANMAAENNWTILDYLSGVVFILGLVLYFFSQNKKRWLYLLSSTAISFALMMVFIVPKIEKISQNAAIEFYESKQGIDCYVDTYEFVSYADLFYTRKAPPTNPNHTQLNWLCTGEVDKPVFVVTKITHKDDFINEYSNFSLLYEKNGFVFFERTDVQKH